MLIRFASTAVLATVLTLPLCPTAVAAPIAVDIAAFGAGSTLVTFDGISDGTEVNGLTLDSLTFSYGGGSGVVAVTSLGFPALIPSNNVSDPVLTAFDPMPAALTIEFTAPVSAFGFGFAFSATSADQTALSITAFSGLTELGTVVFGSSPDPVLPGGFAGIIDETTSFDRVVIVLSQDLSEAFALDNFRTIPQTIPEPSALALLGVAALTAFRRRTRALFPSQPRAM